MTRVVIDTNVWVAGLLSSSGPPAQIIDLVLGGALMVVMSPAILQEYEDVLPRPELDLSPDNVAAVLGYLSIPGLHVVHVDPVEPPGACSDPDDDHFLAAALAGGAASIITGNVRHFPASPWHGIAIASPAAFLRTLSAKRA